MKQNKLKQFFKRHVGAIILLVIVLVFPMCISNQARLNMRVIVTGLAIDKMDEDYNVTAQIVKTSPGNESPGSSAQIDFISDSGKTIAEAISNLTYKAGKISAFSHTSFVIVGSDATKEDVTDFLDYVVRDKILKSSALLLFSDGKASDEIKKTKDMELSVGIGLQKVFLFKEKESDGLMVTVLNFLNWSQTCSKTAFASVLSLTSNDEQQSQSGGSSSNSSSDISGDSSGSKGSSEEGGGSGGSSGGSSGGGSGGSSGGGSESQNNKQNFETHSPIAVFVEGKLKGKLETEDEIMGYMYANPKAKMFLIALDEIDCDCEDDGGKLKVSIQVKSKSNSSSIRFENGVPCFDLKVKIDNAEIKEVISGTVHTKFTDNEFEEIKRQLSKKISESVSKCFEKSRELNADVLCAFNNARKFHNGELTKYFTSSDEFIKKVKLNVIVEVNQLEY